ncbi:DMT family transporter [Mycoplasma sp. Mirounga ES2805-ORL]|uniref:DMT family transporter n=1 Tax=Mycoplasma sp. Mirounga ES2805-ORL TaxID=754514 RepID=UPI00197BE7E9|nr:hypothetical protein [Mycoplasma sp. Mirounga ES2805-ORL]QSF13540.1 hypothetical protein JXZ90_02595 [Mycoplasma sp. Mirounga ES2805-ORL]
MLEKESKIKENISGILGGVFFAVDSTFIVIYLIFSFSINYLISLKESIVLTFLHDFFSFIWSAFYILGVRKQYKELLISFKNKYIFVLIISSIIGAPLGTTMYYLSIQRIGLGKANVISSLYPLLSVMLGYFFLKQKNSWNVYTGFSIAILSGASLGISTWFNNPGDILGYIFAVICFISWGLEAFLSTISLKKGMQEVPSIMIRNMVSSLTFLIFIIPSIKAFNLTGKMLQNINVLWIIGASFFGTISLTLYYRALHKLSISVATAMDTAYAAWAILIELIILIPCFREYEIRPWYEYLISFILIIGVILTIINFDKKSKFKNKKT